MQLRSAALLATTLTVLTACGEERAAVPEERPADREIVLDPEAAEPAAEASTPAASPRIVAVSDVLGGFEGETFGMAAWEHPSLAFESAMLVANGEAGLAVVPVDTEVELSTVEGTFDGGVASGYLSEGGSLVAAASGETVRLYSVDDTRAFELVAELDAAGGAPSLCMSGSTLLRIDEDAAVTLHGVALDEEEATVDAVPTSVTDAIACAASEDGFYVLSEGGQVSQLDSSGTAAAAGEPFPEVSSMALIRTMMGAGLLLASDGSGRLFAAATPLTEETVEPVTIVLQGQPLPGAASIAAGSGNYGSVYRDGVVALLGEDGTLSLLPYAGVARAFGFEGTDSRSLRPRAAISLPALELSVPELEPAAPTSEADQ